MHSVWKYGQDDERNSCYVPDKGERYLSYPKYRNRPLRKSRGILVMFLIRAKDIYLIQSIETGLCGSPAELWLCF